MQIDSQQASELTSGGNTLLHYHLQDREPTHDTINQIQALTNVQTKTADYTPTEQDDVLLADTSGGSINFTLPPAKNGKEYVFKKLTAAHSMIITPTAPDTIDGAASHTCNAQWSCHWIKAYSGGWVILTEIH